jgi:hypothetical protein
MFGCFRRQEANDPDIYVAAIAAVLNEYPPAIIDYVTDPRTGLPNTLKWLPAVAEVREACNLRFDIAKNLIRIQRMAEQKRRLINDPAIDERSKILAIEWLANAEKNHPSLFAPAKQELVAHINSGFSPASV